MSSRTIWKRLLALTFAFAVVATACGGDGDGDDTATTDDTASADDTATTDDTASTDDTATADDTASTDDTAAPDDTATTDDTASTDDTAAASGDAGGTADLELATTDLGDVLVDADGFTVYLFTPDGQGESTCYDECEANWPIVSELSTVGDGLDASLLGTTERTTGDVQATYNGWPLYYFVNDTGPGDTNGQGVNDVWYVVDAAGNAIEG